MLLINKFSYFKPLDEKKSISRAANIVNNLDLVGNSTAPFVSIVSCPPPIVQNQLCKIIESVYSKIPILPNQTLILNIKNNPDATFDRISQWYPNAKYFLFWGEESLLSDFPQMLSKHQSYFGDDYSALFTEDPFFLMHKATLEQKNHAWGIIKNYLSAFT